MNLNMRNIVLILIIVMVGSFLIAAALGTTVAPFWDGNLFNPHVEPFDETREFAVDEIRAIEAETISTEINLIPTEDTGLVTVHLYGEVTPDALPDPFAQVSGDRLTVSARPRPGINNTRINLTMDIYVPAGYVETLRADSVSGDLHVRELDLKTVRFNTVSGKFFAEDLNLDSVSFHSVSGDLRAQRFTAQSGDFNTTSGNIDITAFHGDISASSVSGDLTVAYGTFANDITFNTTSGKTRLSLPADASFSVRLDTTSGDVNTGDFPVTIQSSSRNRFEGTVGSGDNSIQVRSVSGDVTFIRQ